MNVPFHQCLTKQVLYNTMIRKTREHPAGNESMLEYACVTFPSPTCVRMALGCWSINYLKRAVLWKCLEVYDQEQ